MSLKRVIPNIFYFMLAILFVMDIGTLFFQNSFARKTPVAKYSKKVTDISCAQI
jgi:hypothetical protein